jgi:CRISPR-associated exonuclease Cas4
MTDTDGHEEFSQDDLIPISSVADLIFCERRAALHFLEGTWEENQFTAEGHILHDKTHEIDCEMRKDVRIVRGLRLRSLKLGLSGVADVVEFHRVAALSSTSGSGSKALGEVTLPGVKGFWMPFPVEYKRGKLKHEKSYEIQICAQALCLEEMLNARIADGAIFYGKSMRRHNVVFTDGLRKETEDAARRMHSLIELAITPKPIYAKKCNSCSIFEECLPKTIGRRASVRRYIDQTVKSA